MEGTLGGGLAVTPGVLGSSEPVLYEPGCWTGSVVVCTTGGGLGDGGGGEGEGGIVNPVKRSSVSTAPTNV